jgi:hypothetical protein
MDHREHRLAFMISWAGVMGLWGCGNHALASGVDGGKGATDVTRGVHDAVADDDVEISGALADSGPDVGLADGIDGPSRLAGLRIALVGTANPNSEAALLAWLQQNTGTPVPRILTDSSELNAALLAKYDVLITERLVRSYSATEAAILATWVAAGGAVMSVNGFYASGADNPASNSFLAGVGLMLGSYVLGGPGDPGTTTALLAHPITDGLDTLPFWGGFGVQPTPTTDGLGMSTTVAMVDTQSVAIAQVRGAGRVLMWGDEWIEMDSQFALPTLPRFWLQALTWLARR